MTGRQDPYRQSGSCVDPLRRTGGLRDDRPGGQQRDVCGDSVSRVIEQRPFSGYELLGDRRFRELWTANFVSNLGWVMLLLASAWVMTSITENALMVALVQVAVSLPFLFFSIPFGILSDLFGHRRLLMVAHAWMLLSAGALALVARRGQLTSWLLLSLLTWIGVGAVFQQSSWKPLLCDLVPRDRTVAALSLNSLSNKLGQAAGPIIGGSLMGFSGVASVFAVRALSHVVMLLALRRVPRRAVGESEEPPASLDLRRSLREGWSFLRGSPEVHGPLIRCAVFMAPCAGMVALLPLEARENIQTEVIGFGELLTALGLGTVSAVSLMPLLQKHFRMSSMATAALAVFSLAVLGISQWDSMLLDAIFLLFAGLAWGVLSVSHQVSVQTCSPDNMRGLTTSFYALTVQGSSAGAASSSG